MCLQVTAGADRLERMLQVVRALAPPDLPAAQLSMLWAHQESGAVIRKDPELYVLGGRGACTLLHKDLTLKT